MGVVKESGRTADDRVIKAELSPPHEAGRPATVRLSRLLLMTWAGLPRTGGCPYTSVLMMWRVQQCWRLD